MKERTRRVLGPTSTFEDLVLGRIDLLREVRGGTCRSLSLKMRDPETGEPRAHNTVTRMLYPSSETDFRAPRLSQVDEVLAAFELPPSALFEPVLSDLDALLLRSVSDADGGTCTSAEILGEEPGADASLARLVLQSLVTVSDGRVSITQEGRVVAAGLPPAETATAQASDETGPDAATTV